MIRATVKHGSSTSRVARLDRSYQGRADASGPVAKLDTNMPLAYPRINPITHRIPARAAITPLFLKAALERVVEAASA